MVVGACLRGAGGGARDSSEHSDILDTIGAGMHCRATRESQPAHAKRVRHLHGDRRSLPLSNNNESLLITRPAWPLGKTPRGWGGQ